MKSSIFLAASSAMLAMAGPMRAHDERAVEVDWVYEVVTVTVTAGQEPEPSAAVFMEPEAVTTTKARTTHHKRPTHHHPPPPPPETTTVVAPPAPEPTTEAPPPPPAPTTTTAKPKPTTVVEQPPPAETTVASSPDLGDFENSMLDQHNVHRLNHSAPALTWDTDLASAAKQLASTCVFEHDTSLGVGGYGQNLASWGGSGDIDDMQIDAASAGVTMQWYNDEMENWSFYGEDNPPEDSSLEAWGHFTQVVWKSSTKIGCAAVKCDAGTLFGFESWYTVCNYDPPGNYGGEYGTNVLKPLGQKMAVV